MHLARRRVDAEHGAHATRALAFARMLASIAALLGSLVAKPQAPPGPGWLDRVRARLQDERRARISRSRAGALRRRRRSASAAISSASSGRGTAAPSAPLRRALRSRRAIEDPGAVLSTQRQAEGAAVERLRLEGVTSTALRAQDDRIVVCDDRGRVLVVSPDGDVLHEWRVS